MALTYPITFAKVTAWTWYHYDLLLTFSDEIDLIWQRTWVWSWSIGLFFFIRLATMALLNASVATIWAKIETRGGCQTFDNFTAGGTFVLAFSICIMLQIRVYAMYMRNKRLVLINALLFACVVGGAGIIVGLSFHKQELTPEPNSKLQEHFGTCFQHNGISMSAALGLPLIYVLYLAILTVARWSAFRKTHPGEAGTLISLLVRSNLAYFALILVASTIVIALWRQFDLTPTASVISLFQAAAGIGGTRLTLSLRKEVLVHEENVASLDQWQPADRHLSRTQAQTSQGTARTSATRLLPLPPPPSLPGTPGSSSALRTWHGSEEPLARMSGDLRTVGSV